MIIIFPPCNFNTIRPARFYAVLFASSCRWKRDVILDRRYEWMNRAREKSGLVDSIGFELSSKGVQADAKTPGCLGFVLA